MITSLLFITCGPGGGRTHVQTRNFLVFYMLILQLIFDARQATVSQTQHLACVF